MKIFPAIDLRDGRVVRLKFGDYNNMTSYSDNPVEIAKQFEDAGASNLHIVDLDGAKEGSPKNFDVIEKINSSCSLFTELGGGIRNMERIKDYINIGINRAIIGTAALQDPEFLKEALSVYKEKIAVGVDTKNGNVAISGWLESTEKNGIDFCRELASLGVGTVIYTDISKDGALSGTNLDIYKELAKIENLNIIASGGISFENEICELCKIGTYGAIVGKAIYEKKLDLKRVLELAEDI